jgi:hypothetical protein
MFTSILLSVSPQVFNGRDIIVKEAHVGRQMHGTVEDSS